MDAKPTLQDAYELFALDCESRGFTKRTLQFYRDRLGLFLRFLVGRNVSTLDGLTHTVIRAYLANLQKREPALSSAYIHSHARAIRAFCNFLVREELLGVSPFAKVKMPRLEKKVLPALTAEEVHTILRACEYERDKAIVLFLLDSGVRAAELCALNVGDMDDTGGVTVRQGKGRKDRVTFVGARTRKQVLRYFTLECGGKPKPEAPLFTSQRGGGRLAVATLRQLTRRLRAATGVKNCKCHAFRRTMAIQSLRNGMNVYVLAKMLGHDGIDVLRYYLDILQDDVKAAAKSFGVVDNLL